MKKLILASFALLLVSAVVPAMAGEKSNNSVEPAAFQALSQLSVPEQMTLDTMTDKELAAVEGAGSSYYFEQNIYCYDYACEDAIFISGVVVFE